MKRHWRPDGLFLLAGLLWTIMALSGWNQDQYIDFVTDPADITEAHVNIPVRLTISAASGKTNANCIGFFTALGSSWKKVAVEIDGSGQEELVQCLLYDATAKIAEYWTCIPQMSTSSAHTIRLYYDENHADNPKVLGKTPYGYIAITDAAYPSSTSRWINKQNRVRIVASAITDQTEKRGLVQLVFDGSSGASNIGECWIGKAASSGNPYDFDGNQVQVTFGGNPGVLVDKVVYSDLIEPADWLDGSFDVIVSYSTSNVDNKLPYKNVTGWTNYSASLVSPDESGMTVPNQSYSSDTECYHLVGLRNYPAQSKIWQSYTWAYDLNDDVDGTGSDPLIDATGKISTPAILYDTPDNWDGPFSENKIGRYIKFDGVAREIETESVAYIGVCEFACRFLSGDDLTTTFASPSPRFIPSSSRWLVAEVLDDSGTMKARVYGLCSTYGNTFSSWITYGSSRSGWFYGAIAAGSLSSSYDHSIIDRLAGVIDTATAPAGYPSMPVQIGQKYTNVYQKTEFACCRLLPLEKATLAWLKTMALGDSDTLFTVTYHGSNPGTPGDINSSLPFMTCLIAASYAEGGSIDAALPSMTCQMADDSYFFGDIGASIPALTCEMYGGRPHYIEASIPAMTGLFIEAGNHIVAELPLMYATFENSHLSGAMALPKMTCRMDAGASLESSLARMEISDAVGYSGYVADISAELPGLETEGYIGALLGASLPNLACFMFINTGYDVWLAGALPRLTGQLQGQSEVLCGIDAKLTRVTGRLTGNTNGVGNIAAELPALVISDGTVFNGLVGRASSRLPRMRARLAGAVSDVTAIEAEIPAMLIDGVILSDCVAVLHHIRGAVR